MLAIYGIRHANAVHDVYYYRGSEHMNFANIANREVLLDRAYESFGSRVQEVDFWYNPTWTTYNVTWDHPQCRLNNPHLFLYFSEESGFPISFTFGIKSVNLTYAQSTYWTAGLYDMSHELICRLCWIIKAKNVSVSVTSEVNEVWNNSAVEKRLVGVRLGLGAKAGDYKITSCLAPLVKQYQITQFYLGLLSRRNIGTITSGTDPSVVHNAFLDPHDLWVNF